MRQEKISAERLTVFSDAVFAVIVTIMVLELKAPEESDFSNLLPLWPTALSYAVSYLFLVIIWINNHHLMRFVGPPSLGLIWINFAHLFLVSLLPFATAWIARTRLASPPVVFYAALFVSIDIAYNVFEHRVLARADTKLLSSRMRSRARRRSLIVQPGKASIADCACGFHARYADSLCCAACGLWRDLRLSDPPLETRGARAHKSMTTSPLGCEQQTRRLPTAGLSSGSGP